MTKRDERGGDGRSPQMGCTQACGRMQSAIVSRTLSGRFRNAWLDSMMRIFRSRFAFALACTTSK